MNTDLFHADEREERQHSSAIQKLAQEEGFPEEKIWQIYREVLNDYGREAKVKLFLPILVSKTVKDMLHRNTGI